MKCSRKVCATKTSQPLQLLQFTVTRAFCGAADFNKWEEASVQEKSVSLPLSLSLIYPNINNVTMTMWNISKRFITSFDSWQSTALLINYKKYSHKKGSWLLPAVSLNQKISVTIRKTQSWQIWTSSLTFSVSEESSRLDKQ